MLQHLSCSVWVPLGASLCRRGEQLPNSFCSQGTGGLASAYLASSQHLPRKHQLVFRDLHAGITHPNLTHHPLHSLSQPPHPSHRQGWGSVPTLISRFPLENRPVILVSLGLERLGTAGVKPPPPPSRGDLPSQHNPSLCGCSEAQQCSERQQLLLVLLTMDAVLSSPLGTAWCLQLSMTKGARGARRTSRGVSQPLLPCESASSTPPVKGKGREKEEGECCRKALPFQEAGLTQEVKTTNTSAGTDKHRVLPTTCHRQGLKFLSPEPAHSATQQGELLAWMGSAAGLLRSQPQPGFPYSRDSVPQALKAEMLLRALHLSAPMYILAAGPSPALLLGPQDSEPQILRVKKEHGTSCPSTAEIS